MRRTLAFSLMWRLVRLYSHLVICALLLGWVNNQICVNIPPNYATDNNYANGAIKNRHSTNKLVVTTRIEIMLLQRPTPLRNSIYSSPLRPWQSTHRFIWMHWTRNDRTNYLEKKMEDLSSCARPPATILGNVPLRIRAAGHRICSRNLWTHVILIPYVQR